jgi:hypothetical protein
MRPLQHLFVLVVVGLYAWEQLHPVFEVVVCVIEARMRMCDPACIARHGHPRFSYRSLSFVRRVPLSQPSFMRRVQFQLSQPSFMRRVQFLLSQPSFVRGVQFQLSQPSFMRRVPISSRAVSVIAAFVHAKSAVSVIAALVHAKGAVIFSHIVSVRSCF